MDTSSGKTRNLVLLSKIILEHPILIELAVIFGTGQGGLRRRRWWRNIIVNRAKWIIRIEGAYILMWQDYGIIVQNIPGFGVIHCLASIIDHIYHIFGSFLASVRNITYEDGETRPSLCQLVGILQICAVCSCG